MLRNKKHICVVTGAGISVSCGIPDFRTMGSGLYSTLDCNEFSGLSCAEDLFDYEFFQYNPVPFFQFAQRYKLYDSYFATTTTKTTTMQAQSTSLQSTTIISPDRTTRTTRTNTLGPSDAHKFLGKLQETGKLLRVYSQNMDALEEKGGVSSNKVVYAHGSLRWAYCLKCKQKVDAKEIQNEILAGQVAYCKKKTLSSSLQQQQQQKKQQQEQQKQPPCQRIIASSSSLLLSSSSSSSSPIVRRTSSRKRPRPFSLMESEISSSNVSDAPLSSSSSLLLEEHLPPPSPQQQQQGMDVFCGGLMKPGITFFGQPLQDQVGRCLQSDQKKVDALIVIGTSLSVAPISKVVSYLPSHIPRILINRTVIHPPKFSSSNTKSCSSSSSSKSCSSSSPPVIKQQQEQPTLFSKRKKTTTTTTTTNTLHQRSSSKKTKQGDPSKDDNNNNNNDDNDDDDEEFRKNYVFDAYLLGYCDDITRALAKHVFASSVTNNTKKHTSVSCDKEEEEEGDDKDNNNNNEEEEMEGVLLANLLPTTNHNTNSIDKVEEKEDKEECGKNYYHHHHHHWDDWSNVTVPHDRVFLFPGAQPPTTNNCSQ